jgi:hypothetical protein
MLTKLANHVISKFNQDKYAKDNQGSGSKNKKKKIWDSTINLDYIEEKLQ